MKNHLIAASALVLGALLAGAVVIAQDRGAAAPAGPPTATAPAQNAGRANRPPPPTRDPRTPGYVNAKELADGAVPPLDAEGDFILGPTHNPAPEMTVRDDVPHGTVNNFTMASTDSKIYPGI